MLSVTRENGMPIVLTGSLTVKNLYQVDNQDCADSACVASTSTCTTSMLQTKLWHARYGHTSIGGLMRLQTEEMLEGLPLLTLPPKYVCEGCVLGKMARRPFPKNAALQADHKLQLIHSDVCGPMRTTSLGGNLYFVLFIDDYSKYGWVYPMKTKAEVFKHFQHFKTLVENESSARIQTLRTDNGGEYLSNEFKAFLADSGIKH